MLRNVISTAMVGFLLLIAGIAQASSDVGYIIQRGGFSVTVRYSIFLAERSKDDERYKLDRTFRELAQWVWDNRRTLEKRKREFTYSIDELKNEGGGLLGRDFEGYSNSLAFKAGEMGKLIIADLSRRLKIKAASQSESPAKLVAVYFELEDDKASSELQRIARTTNNQGEIFIGAFPGGGCDHAIDLAKALGKKDGKFNCGHFFWSDRRIPANMNLETLEVPLTSEFLKKYMPDGP